MNVWDISRRDGYQTTALGGCARAATCSRILTIMRMWIQAWCCRFPRFPRFVSLYKSFAVQIHRQRCFVGERTRVGCISPCRLSPAPPPKFWPNLRRYTTTSLSLTLFTNQNSVESPFRSMHCLTRLCMWQFLCFLAPLRLVPKMHLLISHYLIAFHSFLIATRSYL